MCFNKTSDLILLLQHSRYKLFNIFPRHFELFLQTNALLEIYKIQNCFNDMYQQMVSEMGCPVALHRHINWSD